MHNYYSQPIYYRDVSKCCESLTNWGILLNEIARVINGGLEQLKMWFSANRLYVNVSKTNDMNDWKWQIYCRCLC